MPVTVVDTWSHEDVGGDAALATGPYWAEPLGKTTLFKTAWFERNTVTSHTHTTTDEFLASMQAAGDPYVVMRCTVLHMDGVALKGDQPGVKAPTYYACTVRRVLAHDFQKWKENRGVVLTQL